MLAFLTLLSPVFAADAPAGRVGAVSQLPDLPGLVSGTANEY